MENTDFISKKSIQNGIAVESDKNKLCSVYIRYTEHNCLVGEQIHVTFFNHSSTKTMVDWFYTIFETIL